jgi:hypothetical protein
VRGVRFKTRFKFSEFSMKVRRVFRILKESIIANNIMDDHHGQTKWMGRHQ